MTNDLDGGVLTEVCKIFGIYLGLRYTANMAFTHLLIWSPWIAVLFVVCSGVQAVYLLGISRRTVRAVGKIVDLDRSSKRIIATIEYVTQKGKRCRMHVPAFFEADDWRKGKTIALRYRTKQPTEGILERSIRAGWGRAGAFLGLGALLFMVGLIVGR